MAGGLPARAALGAALAAILAAARFPAPAPGRPTVPFDLDEVRVGVHQGNAAGEPLGVRVTLVRERGWLERWFGGELRCGVAGPDLRVTVDGEELELAIAGGHEGPFSMSGVEMDLHLCRPAMFSSRRGERRDPLPESRIVLERSDERAEIVMDGVFARRSVRLDQASPLVPGQQVTLTWVPETDRWTGHLNDATHVWVFHPSPDAAERVSVYVAPPELKVKNGRFTFAFPPVRPGPAKVALSVGELEPRLRVRRCRGVARCDAYAERNLADVDVAVSPPP